MNQIFEKFLFHYYRLEKQDYRVRSEVMQWKLEGNLLYLPTMKSDFSLTDKNGVKENVIDAKFYKYIFQENYGKSSFHSHNLYILYTYIMHQAREMNVREIINYAYKGIVVD